MRTAIAISVIAIVAACTPQSGSGQRQVEGRAVAGPTCPVEPASPQPGQCQPRPVAGATLVISDANGTRVASVVTQDDGSWKVSLDDGSYSIDPQPVDGIMGTAPPVDFTVGEGQPDEPVVIEYDTGIR